MDFDGRPRPGFVPPDPEVQAGFRAMLDSGVYLPPSQFEAAFLSAAHTEEDIQRTITAAKQAFASVHA